MKSCLKHVAQICRQQLATPSPTSPLPWTCVAETFVNTHKSQGETRQQNAAPINPKCASMCWAAIWAWHVSRRRLWCWLKLSARLPRGGATMRGRGGGRGATSNINKLRKRRKTNHAKKIQGRLSECWAMRWGGAGQRKQSEHTHTHTQTCTYKGSIRNGHVRLSSLSVPSLRLSLNSNWTELCLRQQRIKLPHAGATPPPNVFQLRPTHALPPALTSLPPAATHFTLLSLFTSILACTKRKAQTKAKSDSASVCGSVCSACASVCESVCVCVSERVGRVVSSARECCAGN